jgi:organic radical activating enzyme
MIKSITSDEFNIGVTVSNSCNFSCKYCSSFLNNGSTPHVPVNRYLEFFTNLFVDNPEIFDYQKRFLSISGGEPSLYNGIDELIEFFYKKTFNITLNSNGSAPLHFWEKNIPFLNTTHISFHPRFCKISRIEDIIKIAINKNKRIIVSIMMDPEYWDRAIESSEHFKKYNIDLVYAGIISKLQSPNFQKNEDDPVDGNYTSLYTDEQLDFVRKNNYLYRDKNINTDYDPSVVNHDTTITYDDGSQVPFEHQKVVAQNLNMFWGYKCSAGKSNIVVNWNADVRGAHCGKFFGRHFGNLIKDENLRIKLLKEDRICKNKKKCKCAVDMRIPKNKI